MSYTIPVKQPNSPDTPLDKGRLLVIILGMNNDRRRECPTNGQDDRLARAEAGQRRKTRQRRVILEELQSVKSHPTAIELFELVRRRLPRVSLGTVYRNLDLLARAGFIEKLTEAVKKFPGWIGFVPLLFTIC